MSTSKSKSATFSTRYVWLFLAALTLIRLALIGRFDLYRDEAFYWMYAQHLDGCYLTNPPLTGWLIWLTTLPGDSEFWVRLGSPILAAAILVVFHRYVIRYSEHSGGLPAVAALTLVPLFIPLGLIMTVDVPLVLFWVLGLTCLSALASGGSGRNWYGVGVALGLGMLSKFIMILFLPVMTVYLAGKHGRQWLRHRDFYVSILLSAVLASPVLIWNLAHDFSSVSIRLTEHLGEAVQAPFATSAGHFLMTQLLLWSPGLILLALIAIVRDLVFWIRTDNPVSGIRAWSAGFPLLFFAVLSLSSGVHPYWTAVAVPPALVSVISLIRSFHARAIRGLAFACLVIPWLAVLTMGAMVVSGRGDRIPIDSSWIDYARSKVRWTEHTYSKMGAEASILLKKLGPDAFLCSSDGYALASLLAYYSHRPHDTYLLAPAGLGKQYLDWNPPDAEGRNGLYVFEGNPGSFPVGLYFERGEWLRKPGKKSREPVFYLGRGFTGYHPEIWVPRNEAEAKRIVGCLYRGFFGRKPDPKGSRGAFRAVMNGHTAHMVWMMGKSEEFEKIRRSMEPEQLVEQFYHGILNRLPEDKEIKEALDLLEREGSATLALRLMVFSDVKQLYFPF